MARRLFLLVAAVCVVSNLFQWMLFLRKSMESTANATAEVQAVIIIANQTDQEQSRSFVPSANFIQPHAWNESSGSEDASLLQSTIMSQQQSPQRRRPKRTNGTLYRCGLETHTGLLAHYLFDDYLDDHSLLHRDNFTLPIFKCKKKYSSDDILVLSAGLCCGLRQFYYMRHKWLRTSFPGKVLFANAENYFDGTGNHVYMISSQQPHHHSVRVPFAAMALVGMISRDKWPILTQAHVPRPRNTGEHFLAYVTFNCVDYRQRIALALSQLGVVHHGSCVPNVTEDNRNNFSAIPTNFSGQFQWTRNMDLFHNYRFCLVLENAVKPFYVTEKLVMAFMAGCVPIWYGTTDVWDIFQKEAFLYVDAQNPKCVQELVRKVRYLEENATAYNEMFQYPILAHGNATLEKYFSLDDSIGNGRLKHEIRTMMGLEDEQNNSRYERTGSDADKL